MHGILSWMAPCILDENEPGQPEDDIGCRMRNAGFARRQNPSKGAGSDSRSGPALPIFT